jgi:hypothetical protein
MQNLERARKRTQDNLRWIDRYESEEAPARPRREIGAVRITESGFNFGEISPFA